MKLMQKKLQSTFSKLDQQYKRAQQEAQAESSVSQAVGEVLRERRIELPPDHRLGQANRYLWSQLLPLEAWTLCFRMAARL